MSENKADFKFPIWAIISVMFFYTILLHYHFGMDASWDTANYHYFLGWITATKKFYYYGAIAGTHTFFNPLCDYLNYITYNASPYVGALYHSIIFTLLLYLVYQIALRILVTSSAAFTQIIALIACVIGGTSPNGVFIFGSFYNEQAVCLFLLLSLLMLIIMLQRPVNNWFILCAGVFAGIAVGLKLTASPYILGLWFGLVCVDKDKIKTMSLFTVGLMFGYFLCEAPFWLLRWHEYRNPVFPVANIIFHSPYLPNPWHSYDVVEWGKYFVLSFIWPVQWLYSTPPCSHLLRDSRILLAFLSILAIFFAIFKGNKNVVRREILLLLICFIVGWIAWIFVFRVFRFILLLNLLSGILLMLALLELKLISVKHKWQTGFILMFITVFLMVTTVWGDGGYRRSWHDSFVQVKFPVKLHKHQLVFIAGKRLSYLVPFIVKDGANVANFYTQSWYKHKEIIEPYPAKLPNISNIFILQYGEADPAVKNAFFSRLTKHRVFVCVKVKTTFQWAPMLCRYKIPAIPANKRV